MSRARATGTVAWKFQRLRAMGAREITWRLRRSGRQIMERTGLAPAAPARRLRGPLRPQPAVLFPRLAYGVREVRQTYPATWRERLVEEAERTVAGDVEIFGARVALGWPPAWRCDPISGRDAGLPFYTALLHPAAERVGDYRTIWEVNRHRSLLTLARAAAVTGEERYARACREGATSFLRDNPAGRGINWVSALEVGLRAIAWSGAWSFLESAGFADDAMRLEWSTAILRGVGFVRRNLSAYSSANNHLIGELASLVITGSVLPDLPAAPRWRRRALDRLAAEVSIQIYPDGVGAEQSMHYLVFTAELAVLSLLASERARENVPDVLQERLRAAARYCGAVTDRAGHVPDVGDSDDAVACPLGVPPAAMPRALPRLIARCLGEPNLFLPHDPESLRGPDGDDELSYWLLPPRGETAGRMRGREAAREAPVRIFPNGGVVVLRAREEERPAEETLAVMDAGPLGYLSLAAHGHADALSVWLSHAGRPVIVDPGTGSYAPARYAEREYFRSARSHATAIMDRRDLAVMRGAFLWGERYTARPLYAAGDNDWSCAEAEHDAYRALGVSVRRRLVVDATGAVLVADVFEGSSKQEHTFTCTWPCALDLMPATPLDRGAGSVSLLREDHPALLITAGAVPLGNGRLVERPRWECAYGEEAPLDGWLSPAYGIVVPAPVVRATCRATPPVVLITLLAPACSGERLAELQEVERAGERGVRLRVCVGTAEDEWWLLFGAGDVSIPAVPDDLTVRARSATIRRRTRGEEGSLTARGAGEFRVRGRLVRDGDGWVWRWASAAVEARPPWRPWESVGTAGAGGAGSGREDDRL
jgi:hypothetical protein